MSTLCHFLLDFGALFNRLFILQADVTTSAARYRCFKSFGQAFCEFFHVTIFAFLFSSDCVND